MEIQPRCDTVKDPKGGEKKKKYKIWGDKEGLDRITVRRDQEVVFECDPEVRSFLLIFFLFTTSRPFGGSLGSVVFMRTACKIKLGVEVLHICFLRGFIARQFFLNSRKCFKNTDFKKCFG